MDEEKKEPENLGSQDDKSTEAPEILKYHEYDGPVIEFEKPPDFDFLELLEEEEDEENEEREGGEGIAEEKDQEEEKEEEEEVDELEEEMAKGEMTQEQIREVAQKRLKRIAEREDLKRKERLKKKAEEIKQSIINEEFDRWNFPIDEEEWTEEDLGEEWAEPFEGDQRVGFDPEIAVMEGDDDDEEVIKEREKRQERQQAELYRKAMARIKAEHKQRQKQESESGQRSEKVTDEEEGEQEGKRPANPDRPPVRPYYVPYRKHYPMVPNDIQQIRTPQRVVEELEMMEEYLRWVSYIFDDGSSYEGTVFDDLAHGKGVYTTPLELCLYEGEWFQNMMQGHGVLEVHVPEVLPPPDSKREKELKAAGYILKTDFMSPEDREWLKMDIEDLEKEGGKTHKPNKPPFEDSPLWLEFFGEKPETGRYRYAGQWKHNRQHGCGVYEINGRLIWGKFYFGELLPDYEECDANLCALHSGLAEVAAAKARMFTYKPDGMVREYKGPFNDPQHPYMYEEEDLWMAPGFINAYYEVPKVWERYVEDVDKEQEMWLNSFIKSPFRIPMPSELEYLWENGDEFLLLGNCPSSMLWHDEENIERAEPDLEGEVLYHVPSGNIINWATDKDGKMRLFIQPLQEDDEVRPEEAIPLPLGFDEFMGQGKEEEKEEEKPEVEKKMTKDELKKKREEETKKEWEKWQEEQKRKWKEEDTEFEDERRLRQEERKLKAQIEAESLEAELRSIEEAEKLLKSKPVVEQEVETKDLSVEDKNEAAVGTGEEDYEEPRSFGKVTEEKLGQSRKDSDNNEDEGEGFEEEEDETKKPQSFGKVAMAEPKERTANEKLRHSPTIFASISFVPPWLKPSFLSQSKGIKSAGTRSHDTDMVGTSTSVQKEILIPKKVRFPQVKISSSLSMTAPLNSSQVSSCKGHLEKISKSKSLRRRSQFRVAAIDNLWDFSQREFLSIAIPLTCD